MRRGASVLQPSGSPGVALGDLDDASASRSLVPLERRVITLGSGLSSQRREATATEKKNSVVYSPSTIWTR